MCAGVGSGIENKLNVRKHLQTLVWNLPTILLTVRFLMHLCLVLLDKAPDMINKFSKISSKSTEFGLKASKDSYVYQESGK